MKKKNFLIIRVFGGLGNQLWQYAVGKSLSLKYKKKLILDISFFDNPFIDLPNGFKAKFELNKFQISKEVLLEKNFYNHSYRLFKYFIRFFPNNIKNFFFIKKNYVINNFIFEKKLFKKIPFEKVLNKKETSYLIGYWQSKDYLKESYEIIKQELQPVYINNNLRKFLKQIKYNYVAIHIRGGDMEIEKHYSAPDDKYYLKIFNMLKKKIKIFIFIYLLTI